MTISLTIGEVPDLQGVWVSGNTLEECGDMLAEVVEGRVTIRIAHDLAISALGTVSVTSPRDLIIA